MTSQLSCPRPKARHKNKKHVTRGAAGKKTQTETEKKTNTKTKHKTDKNQAETGSRPMRNIGKPGIFLRLGISSVKGIARRASKTTESNGKVQSDRGILNW